MIKLAREKYLNVAFKKALEKFNRNMLKKRSKKNNKYKYKND